MDIQTLVAANAKRFKGFRANSKLIEDTEVLIPVKESMPLHPQDRNISVARKTASSSDSPMDSSGMTNSVLDPDSSALFLKSISSSGDRWSRSKLLKMAQSLERVCFVVFFFVFDCTHTHILAHTGTRVFGNEIEKEKKTTEKIIIHS